MAKKMLVDATHPEETRVVVVQGTRLEDFDFESAARKQLIGNIYLAKITRIEPSLQAAFVDYGGNRHGFLAFSEIHPDYYQIPVADRQALLEADAAEEQRAEDADEDVDFQSAAGDAEDAEENAPDDVSDGRDGDAASGAAPDEVNVKDEDAAGSGSGSMLMAAAERDSISSGPLVDPGEENNAQPEEFEAGAAVHAHSDTDEAAETHTHEIHRQATESFNDAGDAAMESGDSGEAVEAGMEEPSSELQDAPKVSARRTPRRRRRAEPANAVETESRQDGAWEDAPSKRIESVGGEDALDEVSRPRARKRHYKIQEVIKKRQIMLVQILKDERGSKGAALTTYLSIPGRYCVLMPNTARGGGISRKITNAVDRKRLKAVAAELEVPEGMGLIIRTAGANRTKTEIKRDFDYLLRQWETIRELTLRSTAPCLINEEGSIVKRAVRDLYDKDIEIIQVEGEASYREAKDFMRMLMPSHAKKVQPYREALPLFQRYQVEAQLDSMFDPTVRLKSGGYIVINPTEALVSIDVNSGKATREANIEATALKTNMEAAEEVARQLRLRDLAGLIVIDFIDMENVRNNKAVERKIKECLASDRANIQIGRISPFGLLEMSRQRLRQGVVETTTRPCSNCHGTGLVRSVDSLALRVLRGIEEECLRRNNQVLDVYVPSDVAIYILNQKRQWLHQIEARAAASIFIIASETIQPPNFEIKQSDRIAIIPPPLITSPTAPEIIEEDEAEEAQPEAILESEVSEHPEKTGGEQRRKRRRGGRGDEMRKPQAPGQGESENINEPITLHLGEDVKIEGESAEDETRRRKLRRRRRGRGRGRERDEAQNREAAEGAPEARDLEVATDSGPDSAGGILIIPIQAEVDPAPETPSPEPWRPQAAISAETELVESAPDESAPAVEAPAPLEAPVSLEIASPEPVVAYEQTPAMAPEVTAMPEPVPPQPLPEAPAGPKRGGWWQRQFGKG